MKRIVLGILCFFTVGAFAQDLPRVETYLGYSFTRVNSGINVPAFSANGGLGEVGLAGCRPATPMGRCPRGRRRRRAPGFQEQVVPGRPARLVGRRVGRGSPGGSFHVVTRPTESSEQTWRLGAP